MTDARNQAIAALGKAVARVLELGIAQHPLAESLTAMLNQGSITLRITIDARPEMSLRVEAVPIATDAEPIEVLRVDADLRGPLN